MHTAKYKERHTDDVVVYFWFPKPWKWVNFYIEHDKYKYAYYKMPLKLTKNDLFCKKILFFSVTEKFFPPLRLQMAKRIWLEMLKMILISKWDQLEPIL